MTSKEIIIKLIDEKKIDGEQAYILINDILQSEMLETYKALENKKNSEIFKNPISPIWVGTSPATTITASDGYTSTYGTNVSGSSL